YCHPTLLMRRRQCPRPLDNLQSTSMLSLLPHHPLRTTSLVPWLRYKRGATLSGVHLDDTLSIKYRNTLEDPPTVYLCWHRTALYQIEGRRKLGSLCARSRRESLFATAGASRVNLEQVVTSPRRLESPAAYLRNRLPRNQQLLLKAQWLRL